MIAHPDPNAGNRGTRIKYSSFFQCLDRQKYKIVEPIITKFRTNNLLNEIQIVNITITKVKIGLIIFFSIIILLQIM